MVVLAVIVAVGAYVGLSSMKPPESAPTSEKVDREIRLTMGEVSLAGPYGFGLDGKDVTSPGPTITVKAGERIRVIITNVGQLPHNFAVAEFAVEGAPALWGSGIGTGAAPIDPNQTGSVVFRAERAGEYFYICQVPGHSGHFKMFGRFVVLP